MDVEIGRKERVRKGGKGEKGSGGRDAEKEERRV